MNDVSKEYSQALFTIAVEENRVGEYASALDEIKRILGENPQYIDLLASPCVSLDERRRAIDAAFEGGDAVERNIASFLKLLCEKGRIRDVFDIIDETVAMLRASEGVSTAIVTSAVELTDAEKTELCEKLEKKLGHRVELECSVDPSLLGGVSVSVDGKLIDGSIRHKLQSIKEIIR